MIFVTYLSKGIVQAGSTEQLVYVMHCGQRYKLTGDEAALWLNGRFSFDKTTDKKGLSVLSGLKARDLVEAEQEDNANNRYQIATRCVFCPSDKHLHIQLSSTESFLIQWLREAGLRLTVAELIYLYENNIQPCDDLCHEHNRQKLVERIYTVDLIEDNVLESQMAKAQSRDKVVNALMRLLKKKRVLVL